MRHTERAPAQRCRQSSPDAATAPSTSGPDPRLLLSCRPATEAADARGASAAACEPPSPRASLPSSLTALPAPCTTLEPPMDTRSISSLMLLSVCGVA